MKYTIRVRQAIGAPQALMSYTTEQLAIDDAVGVTVRLRGKAHTVPWGNIIELISEVGVEEVAKLEDKRQLEASAQAALAPRRGRPPKAK